MYDSATNTPQTFGVLEALQASTALKNAIGHTTVGPELPVSIVPETNPTASLPFYLRQVLAQGHTTLVFILRSNTVVFIPTTQGIFLLDSHLHGNSGAHVAFAEWQHSFELHSWNSHQCEVPLKSGSTAVHKVGKKIQLKKPRQANFVSKMD